MGADDKRKMRLHRKTNAELFLLYESQLVLRHRNRDALEEAKRVLGHFREYLGEFPPSPELATAFLAQFAELKSTTLYRYHSIVKSFMEWYGEKLETRIRLPERLPDYVEQDEIDKLKEAMRSKQTHKGVIERNLLLIELACKAGLRRQELSNLMVRDVDLQRNYLVVRQGKGMKDRIIDLTPSLQQSLCSYLKGKQPDESIFGLSPSTISGIIRWAAKKAGVNIHTHSLRHFFGQSLVDTGTDLETVRRLMGHRSLRTTQVYIGRTDKQRREAIDRLEKPVSKEPPDGINSPGETPNLTTTPTEKKAHPTDIDFYEETDDISGAIKELKAFTASLGGTEFDAVSVIQKLWGRFELGMSQADFVEMLAKCYPSVNPGIEYFEVADSLLEELGLLKIIRSEQRRMSNVRTQWDMTYWMLTDNGRKVVRRLKVDNNSTA